MRQQTSNDRHAHAEAAAVLGPAYGYARMPIEGLVALGVWVALNMMDALLTWHSFGVGGAEGNPLLGSLQRVVGAEGMLTAKVVGASAVGVLVWLWGRRRLLHVINWLMACVLVYNVAIIGYLVSSR